MPITILPETLPSWVINTPYNQSVSASGGTFPYAFTVSFGSLPRGWSLNSATGVITPGTNFTGNAFFAVTATDAVAATQSIEYSFGVVANTPPPLTEQGNLERSLKIYNCCASKKGAEYISKFNSGKDCPELFQDAELMVGLVDSLVGFKLEGSIISGDQATATIDLDLLGLSTIELTIGTSAYPLYTFEDVYDSEEVHATEFADYINYLYSATYPYTATASGTDVIISGINYDADNGIEGTLDIHQESQASVTFNAGAVNLVSFTLTVGGSSYPIYTFSDPADSGDIHAAEFADYVNSLYDVTLFPYTAVADGEEVTIYGIDYSSDNGTAGSLSASHPPFTTNTNFNLSGGIDPTDTEVEFSLSGGTSVLQGENCITNNEVQAIVNKLSMLCSTPCKDIVNFQS